MLVIWLFWFQNAIKRQQSYYKITNYANFFLQNVHNYTF